MNGSDEDKDVGGEGGDVGGGGEEHSAVTLREDPPSASRRVSKALS